MIVYVPRVLLRCRAYALLNSFSTNLNFPSSLCFVFVIFLCTAHNSARFSMCEDPHVATSAGRVTSARDSRLHLHSH